MAVVAAKPSRTENFYSFLLLFCYASASAAAAAAAVTATGPSWRASNSQMSHSTVLFIADHYYELY